MEETFGHMDERISRYFAGEADADEKHAVEAWASQSEENRQYFEQAKTLFEMMNAADIDLPVDVDAAWNKLDTRIEAKQPAEAKVVTLWQRFSPLKIAASVALLLTLGFVAVRLLSDAPQPTVILASNTPREQKLPDGSKVFINKHSEISYEVDGNKRKVKLKGEAFFDVVHNDEQPFEIEIEGVIIQDIGTSFNVKALPGSNEIEVLVESGEVRFYSKDSEGLLLVKGDKAIYNKTTGQFTKITLTAPDNTTSYRSKIFHFNNATLGEVVELINSVYGSNIVLSDEKLGNCRLSVEFNNEELDVIVSVISETLDLQVENRSDAVILKGGVCSE